MEKEQSTNPKSNESEEPGRTPGKAEGSEATVDKALNHKDQRNKNTNSSGEKR
jgi:hypothetical protein